MSSSSYLELATQFQLRPEIAFLNHGSFGACPRPVFAAYQRWQAELEDQPVEFLGRRHPTLISAARVELAAYLGADPRHLVFVPNATFGVNVVANALRLAEGDEVLSIDHEYGACTRAWQYHCERQGAHLRLWEVPALLADPAEFVAQFWAQVTPRTKVIFLSHITSPSALLLPIAAICERAREAGILTVIDGAHAPGQVDLRLDDLGADFYTGNCHKWLCAPKGAGFLYVRPERQTLIEPLLVGWGWRSENPSGSEFHDWFDWTGTHDPAPYLSVPAAIGFQAAHDWPNVQLRCRQMVQHAYHEIAAVIGGPPLVTNPETWFMQMAAFPLPPSLPSDLQARLYHEFAVEIPVTKIGARRFLRISIQAYNQPSDVERLLIGLQTLLS